MEKKFNKKPLVIALGTAFVATLGMSQMANADNSPFAARDLGTGYLQLADNGADAAAMEPAPAAEAAPAETAEPAMKEGEGKCGEGKCGGEMKKKAEEEAQPAEGGATQ